MSTSRATLRLLLLLLVPWGLAPGSSHADELPPGVRAAVDDARARLAGGQAEEAAAALPALDAVRESAVGSVEFWDLYLTVWTASGREPDTFWTSVARQVEDAHPDCVALEILRARRTKDAKARARHVERAVDRAAKDAASQVALAEHLFSLEAYYDAEDVLDAVLEEDPNHERALVLKAELLLGDGMASRVVDLADKALGAGERACFLHLKAKAQGVLYRNSEVAHERETQLKNALASAARAVELSPDSDHVATWAELLILNGEAPRAATVLREHFKKSRAPALGTMLAREAMPLGEYAAAAEGLAPAAAHDLAAAKGLAVAEARQGRAVEARRALGQVLGRDPEERLFAAEVELFLGDGAAARQRLGSREDDAARALRVRAYAWSGEPAAVLPLASESAASGTRAGEDALLALLEARTFERLGGRAEPLRKRLLAARFGAGKTRPKVPEPGSPGFKALARTEGFALRLVTYVRAVCGRFFETKAEKVSQGFRIESDSSGGFRIFSGTSLTATSPCGEEPEREFFFNTQQDVTSTGPKEIKGLEDFAPAQAAFTEGCKAVVDGNLPAAAAAFAKALEGEPHFGRAAVFACAARVLAGEGDALAEVSRARDAVKAWPDDFDARRLVILLRALASDTTVDAEIAALAEREAQYCPRRLEDL
jgi:tetratricopeptide (TPR) repeat protein